MKNPFIYGTIVTGKYFVDREKEINGIMNDLLSGQHIIFIFPQKNGKIFSYRGDV